MASATYVPNTDITSYGFEWTPVGGDGSHSYTCVNTADEDTSYIRQTTAATGAIEYTIDMPTGIQPAGTWTIHWRMRKTSAGITGTNTFKITVTLQSASGVYDRYSTGNLNLNTGTYLIGDTYADYSFTFTLADIDGVSSAPNDKHVVVSIFGGGNVAARVTYVSVETPNLSTDYPQAGAASVTMTGSSAEQSALSHTGGAAATMSGSSTQGYASGGGGTLHTVTGSGTITTVDIHTVTFVPGQGQRVSHVIIDGVDMGEILTYTFPDNGIDHIISVTFTQASTGATSYDLGFYQQGLNREDIGGPNAVESHPENNAAHRGFVPQVRHFVPFPKDFI
jgi:hypothetical protein